MAFAISTALRSRVRGLWLSKRHREETVSLYTVRAILGGHRFQACPHNRTLFGPSEVCLVTPCGQRGQSFLAGRFKGQLAPGARVLTAVLKNPYRWWRRLMFRELASPSVFVTGSALGLTSHAGVTMEAATVNWRSLDNFDIVKATLRVANPESIVKKTSIERDSDARQPSSQVRLAHVVASSPGHHRG